MWEDVTSIAHDKGILHFGVHLWIYNSNKEVLLQHRAPCKLLFPNLWDTSVAGHVGAGEKFIDVAVREAKEELGLDIDKEKIEELFKMPLYVKNKKFEINEIVKVFLYKLDEKINFVFQEEEVDDAKFVLVDELIKKIKSKNADDLVEGGKFFLPALEKIKEK